MRKFIYLNFNCINNYFEYNNNRLLYANFQIKTKNIQL
jgi:hypothetical protein